MNENSLKTPVVKKFARYNKLEQQVINNLPKFAGGVKPN